MSVKLFAGNYEACVGIIEQKLADLTKQVRGFDEAEQLRLKLEKDRDNFSIESARLHDELKEHLEALDVIAPGNTGWEARFLLLIRTLVRATEHRVRCELGGAKPEPRLDEQLKGALEARGTPAKLITPVAPPATVADYLTAQRPLFSILTPEDEAKIERLKLRERQALMMLQEAVAILNGRVGENWGARSAARHLLDTAKAVGPLPDGMD